MIQVLMARREEIDSRDNAVDKQHDLPVYRRVHCLLTLLDEHLDQFNQHKKLSIR
jgi:hypothetical protein